MDCNGHGTHVAGTAAGFGVNADGTTFAGPFGTSVPFASLRIGPGTAPGARVYALRVFGCQAEPISLSRRSTGPWIRTTTAICPTTWT